VAYSHFDAIHKTESIRASPQQLNESAELNHDEMPERSMLATRSEGDDVIVLQGTDELKTKSNPNQIGRIILLLLAASPGLALAICAKPFVSVELALYLGLLLAVVLPPMILDVFVVFNRRQAEGIT